MVAIPGLPRSLDVPGVASSTGPALPTGPALIDELLRDRPSFLARLDDPAQRPALARTLVATVLLGAGVYGGAIGLFRGGLQVPYAALKLPLVLLLTACVVSPALAALRRVVHGIADPGRDALLTLAALGLTSPLLAAQAPLLLLAQAVGVGYHGLTLIAAAGFGLAGAAGVALLFRGLALEPAGAPRSGPGTKGRSRAVGWTTVVIFLLVFSQMAWTLRPWLVRPRTPEVVFVRSLEGSWMDALAQSTRSVRGVYRRERAPLPVEGALPAAVPLEARP